MAASKRALLISSGMQEAHPPGSASEISSRSARSCALQICTEKRRPWAVPHFKKKTGESRPWSPTVCWSWARMSSKRSQSAPSTPALYAPRSMPSIEATSKAHLLSAMAHQVGQSNARRSCALRTRARTWDTGSPTPPCWAAPQYASMRAPFRAIHKASCTDAMSLAKDTGRRAETFLTTGGPDFRRGENCRRDQKRDVTQRRRPKFNSARSVYQASTRQWPLRLRSRCTVAARARARTRLLRAGSLRPRETCGPSPQGIGGNRSERAPTVARLKSAKLEKAEGANGTAAGALALAGPPTRRTAPEPWPTIVYTASRHHAATFRTARRWSLVAEPPCQAGRNHWDSRRSSTAWASAAKVGATSLRLASHSAPEVHATRPKPAAKCGSTRQGASSRTSL
eukprot:9504180-Pyramimonas_sp.AAC.3